MPESNNSVDSDYSDIPRLESDHGSESDSSSSMFPDTSSSLLSGLVLAWQLLMFVFV